MQVCLTVEGHGGLAWADWRRLARTCEDTGIPTLFQSDHYVSVVDGSARGADDAWMTLAGLTQVTTDLRLGTLVSPVGFRHPSVLARMAATADRLSGGRVEVGLGTGWHEGEHRSHGFGFPPLGQRTAMLAEQIELIHRQWRGEASLSFDGRHYATEDLTAAPRPVQRPHPPLIVAGSGGPRTTGIAARWADEYNMAFVDPPELAAQRRRLDAACAHHGRDPGTLDLSLMAPCVLGRDHGDLQRRLRATATAVAGDEDPRAFRRERAGAGWLIGTVEEVGDRLAAVAAAGAGRVVLKHVRPTDLAMVELVAELAPGRAGR